MTKRFWIKLFIEILDDPKMGRLPNHLWRRAVELFLLAGRQGNDGTLPPVEEMVWILRLSEDKLLEDLHGLAEVGVVHACTCATPFVPRTPATRRCETAGTGEAQPGVWVVTNFAKRQAAIPVAERVRRSRIRDDPTTKRSSSGNDDVTNRYKECNEVAAVDSTSTSTSTSISSSVSDSLEEERVHPAEKYGAGGEEKPPDIFQVYQQNIGALTPMIAEALREAESSDGPAWVCAAIEEAVRNNHRAWSYCEAILRRWRRDGFQVDTRLVVTGSRQAGNGKLSPEQLQVWAEKSQAAELR
jgi:DnaD/phage-associated family protein